MNEISFKSKGNNEIEAHSKILMVLIHYFLYKMWNSKHVNIITHFINIYKRYLYQIQYFVFKM